MAIINSERYDDYEEAIRTAFEGMQAKLWTALPAIITNATKLEDRYVLDLQPALRVRRTLPDETYAYVTLPLIINCPVVFPCGGGFTLTFPLKVGDEVLAVFASRCIDGWWQNGGAQNAPSIRMHGLSDGFAIPGIRSQVNLIHGISTDSTQLRSDDGSTFIEVKDGQMVNVTAPGGIDLNGVRIDGSGNTDFGAASVKQGGLHIDSTHFHGGVTIGTDPTEEVVGP